MKKKYFDSLWLVIMFLIVSLGHSQNIITDGDFSSTTEIFEITDTPPQDNTWAYWFNGWDGANAFPTVVDGVCRFDISNLGINQNTWDIQLIQFGFPLNHGHAYELSFDVKADAERPFAVYLGENGGSWISLVGHDPIHTANTEWQRITIPFEAWAVFPHHKLSFDLGTDLSTTYFDNIELVDLGIAEHSIGILGSAVNNWSEDVDMDTADWIHYSLTDFPLSLGELKFRMDDDWNLNWGGHSFPSGYAVWHGPNIFIPYSGNYEIHFNRLSGEYNFQCVSNCLPSIGMVGSALDGWESDVIMPSEDGVMYVLNDFFFHEGEAKFRLNGKWDQNWGGNTFPTGVAILDGPNIPVPEGFYKVTFNLQTGEYGFEVPSVGIIGSAVGSWDHDVDMNTDDGISYTLTDYYLSDGELKFRQDDSWFLNWGGDVFPSGIAIPHGPNFNIPEGTYDIFFNKHTREYSFTATSCLNPELICPEDIFTENNQGMCGYYVYYPEVVPVPNCGGDGIEVEQVSGLPSGSFFPVGTTTNTFRVTNSSGDLAECSFNVTVVDSQSPEIIHLNENYEPLWPPNHKMVEIYLDYLVTDKCTPMVDISISSNEPEFGLGAGDLYPDWEIINDHLILLRAERSGQGDGREYYITISAYDDAMNYTESQIMIQVPHDQKGRADNRIILYPNAADDEINFKGLNSTPATTYQIFNMFGVVEAEGELINNKIDIRTLAPGMHVVKIFTEKGSYFKKFIKK